MPVYMVERTLPGATLESLDVMRRAAEEACRAYSTTEKPIHYLRSTFAPGESRCHCLFEAASADLVRDVNDAAELPYSRIALVVDLARQ
jgi:hypothetical protein